MIKRQLFIFTLICFLILSVTACAAPSEENVVAKINERTVTYGQFSKYYILLTGSKPDAGEDSEETQQLKSNVLDKIVELEIIKDYLTQNNISIDTVEMEKQYTAYKDSIKDDADAQKFLEENSISDEFLKQVISDQFYVEKFSNTIVEEIEDPETEAEKYYDSHKDQFFLDQVKASHILVKTKEEAEEIKQKLDTGDNFEELAKEHSIDGSAQAGGDLGYFSKGRMVKPFEDAAFALEIGEISDIVQSQFGFHIIKVTDKINEMPSLDEIYNQVLTAMYNDYALQRLDEIKSTMTIEKYPKKLS